MTTRLLVTYNSGEALRAFSAPALCPTLVVDNASRDDTRAVAAELGYAMLALDANYGFGTAIMRGLAQIDDELTFIANPDLEIGPDGLAALEAAAARYPECDLFVPAITKADGTPFFRFESRFETRAPHRIPPDGECCIRALSGAAMLVRTRSFETHGFDPNIFLYFEDDDLALAYARDKRPIIYVPEAVARHAGNASSTPSAAIERLKNVSFGWSWGYVMEKHGLGKARAALREMRLKHALALASLRFRRARRHAQVAEGLKAYLRGEKAPYSP